MVDFDLKYKIEKLCSKQSKKEKVQLLYMWIKQGKITVKQFSELLNYI